MKGQAKNCVNNNVTDFWTVLAIALGPAVLWLNPGWQLNTTQLLTHSSPGGWGEESEG